MTFVVMARPIAATRAFAEGSSPGCLANRAIAGQPVDSERIERLQNCRPRVVPKLCGDRALQSSMSVEAIATDIHDDGHFAVHDLKHLGQRRHPFLRVADVQFRQIVAIQLGYRGDRAVRQPHLGVVPDDGPPVSRTLHIELEGNCVSDSTSKRRQRVLRRTLGRIVKAS